MNIKKITALVSAAALAVCMLAACGSNTDSPAETEPAEIIETVPASEANAETSGGAGDFVDGGPLLGGWTVADDTSITPERQQVFDLAMEDLVGVDYTPEAYLASQVVAGTNHCYLCRAQTVYPSAQPYYTLAFIYEDPNGGAEISSFYDLTEAPSDHAAAGGWAAPESSEITEELAGVFDTATEALTGTEYTPVALLEQQVVAGMNYLFLCRAENTVPDAEPYYALVKVFANLGGGAEITNVQELDIGAFRTSSGK